MRFLFTYIFVALFVTSPIFSQESIPYLHINFVSNPQDNKNLIISGWIGSTDVAIVFDIVNDSYQIFDIDLPWGTDIKSIEINAESNRIAYYKSENYTPEYITIYNYLTFEKIQEFKLDSNIKMSNFSKDGSKYFLYNSTENQVLVYNIDDGLLIASHDLAPVNEGYTFTSFNQFADEIAFRRDSTLMFWSIDKQEIINTIPFNEDYTFYSFEDNGNLFSFYYSYKVDGKRLPKYVIGVAHASDGNIKYTRDINDYEPKSFDFTSDMRYLLLNDELIFQNIHDLEEDTYVYNRLGVGNFDKINHLYISPDLEYSIILEYGIQLCGRIDADNSEPANRISTYNFKEKKQIRPLINTFVGLPRHAIISDNNKYVVIYSGYQRNENTLFTIDERFVKYLEVDDAKPVLFIDQSKYIGFMYGQTMKFYNVQTDQFDKEFDTGLEETYFGNTYYYTESGGGRIIVIKDDTINIFKYSDLSLNKSIIISESGIGGQIKFDGKENLIGFDGNKINKYNIFDGSITSDMVENVPDDFIFKSVSPNGRYVLFGKYAGYKNINYEVGIYDMQTDKFRKKDLASDSLNDRTREFDYGLIANLPIVWYYYVYNGTSNDYSHYAYNFDLDTISEYVYSEEGYNSNDNQSYLSNDKSYYINISCPWSYSITKLVDPQSSVETTTEVNGSVYPNPASDFIKIDMNTSAMNSSIEIFDAYGKQVMSVIYSGEDIDISKLTAGVYFVKTQSQSYKFIKL
ncbi:MAG: T9SS type A sorting domain-containing protein [Candidatus Kapaibacterium sp.]